MNFYKTLTIHFIGKLIDLTQIYLNTAHVERKTFIGYLDYKNIIHRINFRVVF